MDRTVTSLVWLLRVFLVLTAISPAQGEMNCAETCNTTCRIGADCQDCMSGRYGDTCEKMCPVNCRTPYCNRIDGTCDACVDGFYGRRCDENCPGLCASCVSVTSCTSCKAGFYGRSCESKCLSRCSVCTAITNCSACNRGYYIKGAFCYGCPASCLACDTFDSCTSCYTVFILNNGSCIPCMHGQYNNGSECVPCQDGCVICSSSKECRVCKAGFFLENERCTTCKNSCATCVSLTSCTTCKDGFHMPHGADTCRACPVQCAKCDTSGSCIACNASFFAVPYQGLVLCEPCKHGCKKCLSSNTCDECHHGFFLQDTTCEPCHDHCRTCSSYTECRVCKPGWFSVSSSQICECSVRECSKHDGPTCRTCKRHDWYPSAIGCCPCPSNCLGGACEKNNGHCLKGCEKRFFGNVCGEQCNETIAYCDDCVLESGIVQCRMCADGKFVRDNECVNCSSFCLNGECYSSTGICVTGCLSGVFGESCETFCSPGCVNESCHRQDGHCSDGCMSGFWENACDRQCDNQCIECDRSNGTCITCPNFLYGKQCESRCSLHCRRSNISRLCDQNTGHCLYGCESGFYGHTCVLNCSSHCRHSTCRRSTGECVDGCLDGFYGASCIHTCSVNCAGDNTKTMMRNCSGLDGSCTNGCNGGFYGDKCLLNCSDSCQNVACDVTTGICLHGCREGYNDDFCNPELWTDKKGVSYGNFIVALVLLSAFVLAVTLTLLRRFIHYCPVSREPEEQLEADQVRPISMTATAFINNAYETIATATVPTDGQVQRPLPVAKGDTKLPNGNCERTSTFCSTSSLGRSDRLSQQTWAVQVHRLNYYVKRRFKDDDLQQEFQSFLSGMTRAHTIAVKQENYFSNRYKSIYPYDDNRVVLQVNEDRSDFINASYINGYDQENAYIAAQGPNKFTVFKFWLMVYQQNCELIVMLTNLVESGVEKCQQYWPNRSSIVPYEDIVVCCVEEDVYADFTIRTFTMTTNEETSGVRRIRQLHFTAWPDKGVPNDVTGLIECQRKLKKMQEDKSKPIIVHCSAGVGRTGTFIALDILTEEGQGRRSVDIPACLQGLRHQRVDMVQTLSQYKFLHRALVLSLEMESWPVTCSDFNSYFCAAVTSGKDDFHGCALEKQFQTMQRLCAEHSNYDVTSAARETSTGRSIVSPIQLDEQRYADSYRAQGTFILVRSPTKSQLSDLLHIVMVSNCACVVTMETANIKWKSIKKTKDQPFTVNVCKTETTPSYKRTNLRITVGKEEKLVSHFTYLGWSDNEDIPTSSRDFVDFVQYIYTAFVSPLMGDIGNRVLLHDRVGASTSGLFCAILVLIEKLEAEDDVSVFCTSWQIKARLPNAISSYGQFNFCYRAVIAYLHKTRRPSSYLTCTFSSGSHLLGPYSPTRSQTQTE